MAAATFDVVTMAEAVTAACQDTGADLFTADEIAAIIGSRVLGTAQTVTFQKYGTYLFTAPDEYRGNPYAYMYANESAPFTGQDDITYDVNSRWGTIIVSAAVTATSISASVIPVDFCGIMHIIFTEIVQRRSLLVAQSLGSYSYDPAGMIGHLKDAAMRWKS